MATSKNQSQFSISRTFFIYKYFFLKSCPFLVFPWNRIILQPLRKLHNRTGIDSDLTKIDKEFYEKADVLKLECSLRKDFNPLWWWKKSKLTQFVPSNISISVSGGSKRKWPSFSSWLSKDYYSQVFYQLQGIS